MPIDLRVKQLSYSSNLTLHSCPRKYQLYKLGTRPDQEEDYDSSITFAFGHLVGLGIQEVFEGKPLKQIIWNCFLMWEPHLLAFNTKQVKSFWLAIAAVQKFAFLHRENGYLKDYELVIHEGKPAVELGFTVDLGDRFLFRGFVDAVLSHRVTGEVMVLEVKTTSAKLNAATYKNSSQAIGYSVVLDHLFPSLSAYKVLYLVYKTKEMEYEQLPFHKSYLQRALWIQELLLEKQKLQLYEGIGVYPMHGESCYSFYRECEYMNLCTLATETLAEPLTFGGAKKILKDNKRKYQVKVTIQELIQAQLSKE
jgi:hypothetical protein